MGDLFERIAALPARVKIGLYLVLILFVPIGYYTIIYSDMTDRQTRNRTIIAQTQKEKEQYENRKTEYQGFRQEVNLLLEEQKELLRVLPKTDDIEQFIESMTAQVELAGLSKVSSVREPATADGMYKRIPIRMSLTGTFHQISRFFKNVGELKRIVTIGDLTLTPNNDPTANTLYIRADFVAQTFQFVEAGAKK